MDRVIGGGEESKAERPARVRSAELSGKGDGRGDKGRQVDVARWIQRHGAQGHEGRGAGRKGRDLNSNSNSFTDKRPGWNNVYILTRVCLVHAAFHRLSPFVQITFTPIFRLARTHRPPGWENGGFPKEPTATLYYRALVGCFVRMYVKLAN